jgi:hypothetical protein
VCVFVPAAHPQRPSCLARPVKALRRTPCSQPELAPFPKAPIKICSHHSADCWRPGQVPSTIPAHYHRDQNGYKWYNRKAVTSGHTRETVTDGAQRVATQQGTVTKCNTRSGTGIQTKAAGRSWALEGTMLAPDSPSLYRTYFILFSLLLYMSHRCPPN